MADARAWLTPPRTGLPRLREALAGHLGLPKDDLVVTQGIRSEVTAALAGARSLRVERPTFQDVPRIAGEGGIEITSVTLEHMLSGDGVDRHTVLWVTSPARNPDGRTLTAEEAARLDELAQRCRRIVINQAYHWVEPNAPRPQRAVLLGSLHKLTGGGVRVGWRVSPEGPGPDRPSLGGPPRAWQSSWADFIERGGLDSLADDGLLGACRRCQRFVERIRVPADVQLMSGGGPSAVLTFPSTLPERDVIAEFVAAGLRVSAGSAFGCLPTAVRLSFAGVRDEQMGECLHRAGHVLTRLIAEQPAAAAGPNNAPLAEE